SPRVSASGWWGARGLVSPTGAILRGRRTRYGRSPVFVLLLTYVRPLPEVDALMREHVRWLTEHYAAGRCVVSGRRIPRTGGVILARGDDPAEIEALAAT